MKSILIIDDEFEMLESLRKILFSQGRYDIQTIQNSSEAMKKVEQTKFDLILTDLKMQDYSGIDILKNALKNHPQTNVIMISGYGTVEASVEAMKEGAFDFIEKPFTSKKLLTCVERALSQKSESLKSLDEKKEVDNGLSAIIYKSEKFENVIQLVKKIAPGNMNVLITGESGTGKELIARAIHRCSKRNMSPFVPVNCGALPENLFESEIFGHEKGAFTGAFKTKPGLMEFANQGTFFFDEIGDLGLNLQVKLLRLLEERKIRRVGGQKEIDIDVRIIAATNKDLTKSVEENNFREDLFYRINTINIEIPPLREREKDIKVLIRHFLEELNSKNEKPVNGISNEAINTLQIYQWPGNVRELQNIISRAFYLCNSEIIQKQDLPLPITNNQYSANKDMLDLSYKNAKEQIIEKFELEYLSHHLRINEGNISKTAEECGLDRRSIHRLIKKYNIIYQE
jgi:DNA-binding NtrC family response regulator